MTAPYGDLQFPFVGVLSEEERAKQLQADACRQHTKRIQYLEKLHREAIVKIVNLECENLSLANERFKLLRNNNNLKCSILAAHGLLVSCGGETSKDSIEAATSILRKAL